MVRTFRDLVVWQKAMDLVTKIYRVTQKFLKEEIFGLVSQLLRAAVSVPSNIAEGQGRLTEKEFRQFLGNAEGRYLKWKPRLLLPEILTTWMTQISRTSHRSSGSRPSLEWINILGYYPKK